MSASSGPAGTLLPWDVVAVNFAEPIVLPGGGTIPTQLTAGGAALPVGWTQGRPGEWASGGDVGWVGAPGVYGLLGNWDVAGTVTLAIAPVADRVGLTSTATTTPLALLSVPSHDGAHGFDDDVVSVATWGSTIAFYGGKTGSDPRCEKGGCVAVGPFSSDVCASPSLGFAGRIKSGVVASSVVVRYRALLRSKLSQGTPVPYMPSMIIDAATPNLPAKSYPITIDGNGVTALATPIDGMTYATPWLTATVAAPAPSSTLGFNVRAASQGCGGPAPEPVDVELLIDSVSAQ